MDSVVNIKTVLFAISFWSALSCYSQKLELRGCSNGKNLYFQNLETEEGKYATDSVFVNGLKYVGEINASAFELKLDSLGYKYGDSLFIVLYYSGEFRPRLLQGGSCFIPARIYTFGLPVYTDNQLNDVGMKYGVIFTNLGCEVNSNYDEHNRKQYEHLKRRNGPDWEKKFWQEVSEKYD